jgi:hypothetical protein
LNNDVGTIGVEVTADDGNGGPVATTSFAIQVDNTDDAPTADQPIPNQTIDEDAAFTFQFDAATFSDVDAGDTLTYSATLVGGAPLPTWLSFDAGTRTFSGTPTNDDVGTIAVEVTADDGNGGPVATVSFNITVDNHNDAPSASDMNDAISFIAGTEAIPLNDIIISDIDAAETVTATLTLADPSFGALSANDGATYNAASGTWTASGSIEQVNRALQNVEFVPSGFIVGDTAINVSIDDGDEDISGPLLGVVTLTADPLPDDPMPILPDASETTDPTDDPEPVTSPATEGKASPGEENATDTTAADAVEAETPAVDASQTAVAMQSAFELSPFNAIETAATAINGIRLEVGLNTEQNENQVDRISEVSVQNLRDRIVALSEPLQMLDTGTFITRLDDMRDELIENQSATEKLVGSGLTLSAGLSVGYVVWLARSGVILSSVLSSLPAWRLIDPLPVLGTLAATADDDDDTESLESMVRNDDPTESTITQSRDT